ncbi:MAG: lamin tail domain-containing protein [Bacteroidota bacterium]
MPKYIGSKTASGTNNARSPVAYCFQIDGLTPATAYDIQAGLGLTTDAVTSYGAGNIWNGTAFSGSKIMNAFTTNAAGSSGPVWIFLEPTGNGSRFDAGQIHNLRVGFVTTGGTMPASPNFITVKTITALDIAATARTVSAADDGAFVAGSALPVSAGKYVLLFDNTAGTGDPLYAYQIRQAAATNGTQTEFPAVINDIFMQAGTSAIGDYPAIIPIGANNPNGVRRIEARSADNTIFASNTDADGIWPSGGNTTTPLRREVVVITNTDAPLQPTVPTIIVTSPNGGEFWQQGTQHAITWSSTFFTDNVKIELTGTHPMVLVASTANIGTYTWNIPLSQPVASDYKVKISDAADGSPADQSNAAFSVVEPYVVPDIVITEIMYNSPGADEEWIELYNNGSVAADMSGFYILDDDPAHITDPIVLPAGSTLAPGGRFTVETATAGNFPFVPNYSGSGKFSFGNTTDQVKLYHRYGQLIDSVKYQNTAPWPTGPNGGGSSLTFCDPSLDNSVATYWSASVEPFQTLQGTTIRATPGSGCYVSSDNVMITEIMYNPPDDFIDSLEFIELYNKGTVGVNLKDWYFSKGVTFVFPDYTLLPGSYCIVARNAVSINSTFGIPAFQWSEGFLDDAGEPLVLNDGVGQVKDSVYYLPVAPWPTTPDNGGPSLTFCNTTLDNSLGENWSASTNQVALNSAGQAIYASPGSSCSSGANLVITEIMYNPPGTGADTLEFIELYNAGNTTNLQGFSFSSGVDYVFPSINLASGEYLLIASNAAAILNTFGKSALQWTSGGLNNTGEEITLKDNFGFTIDDVTYADTFPWDSLADGYGHSLTLCDPGSNNSLPVNWKASTEFAAVDSENDSIFATPMGGCINPTSIASFEANPTNILEGQSVYFHDLSTNNPIEWDWTFNGGTPESSTEQNPVIQYNTQGIYSVTLKATNLYGNNTLTKTDYIRVGVDGIRFQPSGLIVFPNPTGGKFLVTNPADDILEITVFSPVGRHVKSALSAENIISLDLSGLSRGLYLVRIFDKTSQSARVIKLILE